MKKRDYKQKSLEMICSLYGLILNSPQARLSPLGRLMETMLEISGLTYVLHSCEGTSCGALLRCFTSILGSYLTDNVPDMAMLNLKKTYRDIFECSLVSVLTASLLSSLSSVKYSTAVLVPRRESPSVIFHFEV